MRSPIPLPKRPVRQQELVPADGWHRGRCLATGIAQGAATITAGTGAGGANGAKAALDAIKSAVQSLGVVQGVLVLVRTGSAGG